MTKEKILGINVIQLDYKTLVNKIDENINNREKTFIVAINPEKILMARKNKKLLNILNNADYPIPDGIGIIYASRLNKGSIKTRVTGINTMEELCSFATKKKYRVFLYGGKEEIVKKAKEQLEKTYKGINIVGYINGYETNNKEIINKINNCHPDIVFVALGSPKQEYWIYDNMEAIDAKVFQGVGGSFDVISGKTKRAPKKVQKLGLEWLFRLIKEPKRVFRQIKLIKFVFLVLLNKKTN